MTRIFKQQRQNKEYTVLAAVDDVADPRVVDALHVELQTRPVAADDEMIVAEPIRPSVHYRYLVYAADHCTAQHRYAVAD